MLSEGESAPGFELPALVDGERRQVSLAEYLEDNVVILAFYPADFNPACDEDSCDLDELDLFTMQKDVTILGISPDSVYSHRAFAERYDLKVPLLADTDGEVAERYGIDFVDDIGQHLIERGVVVLDHDGTVQYVWSTDKMTQLPRVGAIKDALAETGGDDTAFARYRVGHAHYIEGRRAFTSAMESFQQSEWMLAQSDFDRARDEFTEAADHFDTATRFVDEPELEPIYNGANEKATALWQAADWLTRSASAYSSGSGAEGQKLRDDAERPMETVREYVEPPDPDEEWPPELHDLKQDPTSSESILPGDEEEGAAALTVDIDNEVDGDSEADADIAPEPDTGDDVTPVDAEAEAEAADGETDADDGDKDIDDAEIADLQAEIAANNPDEELDPEDIPGESTAMVEAPPGVDPEAPAADADGPDVSDAEADGTDDESAVESAKEELAELQAELGVDLPDSESADGDG